MSRASKPGGRETDVASDAELAEISRQLRDLLGKDEVAPRPPPAARNRDHARPALSILRFAGGFIVPALILVAVILVQGWWS